MQGETLNSRTEEVLTLVDLRTLANAGSGAIRKACCNASASPRPSCRIPASSSWTSPPRELIQSAPSQIRDLIFTLKDRGFTVFLCSHLLEQVQEVCDHVGIIHQGRLVREGRLEDLISIEDQTEVILRNATSDALEKIREVADHEDGVEWVRSGHPRTTLERLFLQETVEKGRQPRNLPAQRR